MKTKRMYICFHQQLGYNKSPLHNRNNVKYNYDINELPEVRFPSTILYKKIKQYKLVVTNKKKANIKLIYPWIPESI